MTIQWVADRKKKKEKKTPVKIINSLQNASRYKIHYINK